MWHWRRTRSRASRWRAWLLFLNDVPRFADQHFNLRGKSADLILDALARLKPTWASDETPPSPVSAWVNRPVDSAEHLRAHGELPIMDPQDRAYAVRTRAAVHVLTWLLQRPVVQRRRQRHYKPIGGRVPSGVWLAWHETLVMANMAAAMDVFPEEIGHLLKEADRRVAQLVQEGRLPTKAEWAATGLCIGCSRAFRRGPLAAPIAWRRHKRPKSAQKYCLTCARLSERQRRILAEPRRKIEQILSRPFPREMKTPAPGTHDRTASNLNAVR